jgi:hypothetical protein
VPYWRELAADSGFPPLAPEDQFKLLVFRVAQDNATEAAKLEATSGFAAHKLLRHLAARAAVPGAGPVDVLWQVQKGGRTLRCEALLLPHGIDLRLVEAGNFRRTQLVRDGASVSRRVNGTYRSGPPFGIVT